MNENEIKLLWQSTNAKLESSIAINKKNMEDITKMKAQNFLASMKPIKLFTLIAGILWAIPLSFFIVNLFIHAYDKVSLFFLYSALIQVSITTIAVAMYIHQIILINKIDFSEPVLNIQENLSQLKISTLNIARILFLQLPVWTTFYLSKSLFTNGNLFLLALQSIVTLAFLFIAIWLFINIKYENRNKKWFQLIFTGKEWQPLLQSMALINDLQNFQNEESEK
jgi:hypothetical protein